MCLSIREVFPHTNDHFTQVAADFSLAGISPRSERNRWGVLSLPGRKKLNLPTMCPWHEKDPGEFSLSPSFSLSAPICLSGLMSSGEAQVLPITRADQGPSEWSVVCFSTVNKRWVFNGKGGKVLRWVFFMVVHAGTLNDSLSLSLSKTASLSVFFLCVCVCLYFHLHLSLPQSQSQ